MCINLAIRWLSTGLLLSRGLFWLSRANRLVEAALFTLKFMVKDNKILGVLKKKYGLENYNISQMVQHIILRRSTTFLQVCVKFQSNIHVRSN